MRDVAIVGKARRDRRDLYHKAMRLRKEIAGLDSLTSIAKMAREIAFSLERYWEINRTIEIAVIAIAQEKNGIKEGGEA